MPVNAKKTYYYNSDGAVFKIVDGLGIEMAKITIDGKEKYAEVKTDGKMKYEKTEPVKEPEKPEYMFDHSGWKFWKDGVMDHKTDAVNYITYGSGIDID